MNMSHLYNKVELKMFSLFSNFENDTYLTNPRLTHPPRLNNPPQVHTELPFAPQSSITPQFAYQYNRCK